MDHGMKLPDKDRSCAENFTRQFPLRQRVLACIILLLLTGISCRSVKDNNSDTSGIIVVNAPATGEVKRILTAEGVHVNQGTPIVEIAIQNSIVAMTPKPGESAEWKLVVKRGADGKK